MAAIRFKLSVDQTGQLAAPVLTPAQLTEIGNNMVKIQKARWARAENVANESAKPLAKTTAKAKQTFGQNPVRNMLMTGLVWRDFTLRSATMTEIRAENTSRAGRMHARKAQSFEQMIGFSPAERNEIFGMAYRAYDVYLQRAWRPITNG